MEGEEVEATVVEAQGSTGSLSWISTTSEGIEIRSAKPW
jgi:hypothetical protein